MITPSSYRYICTRIILRKKRLIPPDQYIRLLNMDITQIIRYLGEIAYLEEINLLSARLSGISLLEAALNRNLAATFRNILLISPGALKELAELYFIRWDIENVLLIMRGCQFNIPPDRIREVLIPAGSIAPSTYEKMLQFPTLGDIPDHLDGWQYQNIIRTRLDRGYRKGIFAELENELMKMYYTDISLEARFGIRGGSAVLPHLRFEIDILNIRNTFRLRAGSRVHDIRSFIIPGGNLHADDFQRLYLIDDRESFVAEMDRAGILAILTQAIQRLTCDPSVCKPDAAEMIWNRWAERKTPLYTVMLAVNSMLLKHLDDLSRRNPFSVLPILAFLEHKRYEILNLRAIARGKQFGVNPDFIRQHLVM